MNKIQVDKEVKEYLDSYKVDFPDEEEIESSIELIMSQVQPKQSRASVFHHRAKILVVNSIQEFFRFGYLFWGLNSLFLLLGMVGLINLRTDPYVTAFALAPLPFMVGILEILKSKDDGLIELEMTLKYNAQQIFISRLLVVGLFNLMVNIGISSVTMRVFPDVILSKLLLAWTIPYVLVTGLAFLFAMNMKGNVASGVLLAVWFAVCYGLLQVEEIMKRVFSMDILPAAGILLAGVLLWTVNLVKIKRFKIGREYYEA